MSNGVADLYLLRCLDTRNDVAHVAGRQLFARSHVELEHTDFIGIIFLACRDKFHEVARLDCAIDNLEVGDDATEWVEHRVEDECLQWRFRVALRSRHTVDDSVENFLHTHAGLTAGTDDFFMVATEEVDYLVFHFFRLCTIEVALVDDRDNLEVVVDSHVEVGNGLSLNALRAVDNQQCTLTSSDRARHFVREVDVSRSVNEVEDICLTVVFVFHLDSVALDGDASLFLKVHVVKHLSFHVFRRYGVGKLEQTVCQSTFAVVDVCNDAKIADILHFQLVISVIIVCLSRLNAASRISVCNGSRDGAYSLQRYYKMSKSQRLLFTFLCPIIDTFALFSRNQVFNALKGAKNPSVAFEVATARDRGIVQQIYNLVSRQ